MEHNDCLNSVLINLMQRADDTIQGGTDRRRSDYGSSIHTSVGKWTRSVDLAA
jgi:hypothetical protein